MPSAIIFPGDWIIIKTDLRKERDTKDIITIYSQTLYQESEAKRIAKELNDKEESIAVYYQAVPFERLEIM
jgi:hypothetical protein